jgi:hypothetical protein
VKNAAELPVGITPGGLEFDGGELVGQLGKGIVAHCPTVASRYAAVNSAWNNEL